MLARKTESLFLAGRFFVLPLRSRYLHEPEARYRKREFTLPDINLRFRALTHSQARRQPSLPQKRKSHREVAVLTARRLMPVPVARSRKSTKHSRRNRQSAIWTLRLTAAIVSL